MQQASLTHSFLSCLLCCVVLWLRCTHSRTHKRAQACDLPLLRACRSGCLHAFFSPVVTVSSSLTTLFFPCCSCSFMIHKPFFFFLSCTTWALKWHSSPAVVSLSPQFFVPHKSGRSSSCFQIHPAGRFCSFGKTQIMNRNPNLPSLPHSLLFWSFWPYIWLLVCTVLFICDLLFLFFY